MISQGLMFGNIVGMGKHNIPVVIREMDCNGITYDRLDATEVVGHCEWEHLSPIPLSEDILLKCYFVLQQGQWYNKMYLQEFGTGKFKCMYAVPWLTSLHQLQNLYYSLTGQELKTDNL